MKQCIICDKATRGTNRVLGICHRHFNFKFFMSNPRRTCSQMGCNTKVRQYFHLFCYKHDQAKQAARKLKPFLRDLEALVQMENDNSS